MRESLYQGVGILATQAAGFFAAGPEARGLWAPALTGGLEAMPAQHARLLIRHIVSPLCRACPPAHRAAWLVPVLNRLVPHMLERLGAGWRALDAAGPGFGQGVGFERGPGAGAGLANGAHAAAAEDEVVAERLLRELTQEHMLMLKVLQQPAAGGSQVRLPRRCHWGGAQAELTQEHMLLLKVLQQPAAGGSQVWLPHRCYLGGAQAELTQEHMRMVKVQPAVGGSSGAPSCRRCSAPCTSRAGAGAYERVTAHMPGLAGLLCGKLCTVAMRQTLTPGAQK